MGAGHAKPRLHRLFELLFIELRRLRSEVIGVVGGAERQKRLLVVDVHRFGVLPDADDRPRGFELFLPHAQQLLLQMSPLPLFKQHQQ